jgi:two-component system chemotaxis response regulator CheB
MGQVKDAAIIAIGASTGGTVALEAILSRLPADVAPIVIVQHTLRGFTAPLARRLDTMCPMHVEEATDRRTIRRGEALVAPGGAHLVIERRGSLLQAVLRHTPAVHFHRPSVDMLFHSLAALPCLRVIAVLLTGMGRDGADGMLALRQSGAQTIVQDEQSSAVFGMPKAARDRGGAVYVSSLDALPARIVACLDLRPNC